MYNFKQKRILLGKSGKVEDPHLREFIRFIRLKIAIFGTGLALLGYLMFSPISINLLFVSMCAFFATTASYSFNLLTDKEEDSANGGKLNYFVLNLKKGQTLVLFFIALGALPSVLLSKMTILFYGLIILLSLSYSFFRIKKICLLKNISTGLILSLLFLFGAAPDLRFTQKMIFYYLIISFYVFILSLLTDLRDYDEDKIAGIKTLSVLLGRVTGTKIVYASIFLFLVLVMISNSAFLYPLFLFVPLAFFFLKQRRYKDAQLYLMFSLLLGPIGMIVLY